MTDAASDTTVFPLVSTYQSKSSLWSAALAIGFSLAFGIIWDMIPLTHDTAGAGEKRLLQLPLWSSRFTFGYLSANRCLGAFFGFTCAHSWSSMEWLILYTYFAHIPLPSSFLDYPSYTAKRFSARIIHSACF
jgi:hypothetical protein